MNSSISESSTLQPKNAQQKPCDGCKAHHTKCDKNADGCKNCSRRGISCTYLIERKRRGPKTKVEHFMRHYESLHNTSSNKAPEMLFNKYNKGGNVGGETYCYSQYTPNPNFNMSSPNLNTSFVLNENVPYQTSSYIHSMYQNIHNPMLDSNCYNTPLPQSSTSIVSPDSLITSTITAITTTTMDYEFSPAYIPPNQLSFESSIILDQNGFPIIFN